MVEAGSEPELPKYSESLEKCGEIRGHFPGLSRMAGSILEVGLILLEQGCRQQMQN